MQKIAPETERPRSLSLNKSDGCMISFARPIVPEEVANSVAELRPLSGVGDPMAAALQRLAAEGVVTLPRQPGVSEFIAVQPPLGALLAADAVSRNRDERG